MCEEWKAIPNEPFALLWQWTAAERRSLPRVIRISLAVDRCGMPWPLVAARRTAKRIPHGRQAKTVPA
jgi:hypothetical protein